MIGNDNSGKLKQLVKLAEEAWVATGYPATAYLHTELLALQSSAAASASGALLADARLVNAPYEPRKRVIGIVIDEDKFQYMHEAIDWLRSMLVTAPCNMDVIVSHERHEHLLACEKAAQRYNEEQQAAVENATLAKVASVSKRELDAECYSPGDTEILHLRDQVKAIKEREQRAVELVRKALQRAMQDYGATEKEHYKQEAEEYAALLGDYK